MKRSAMPEFFDVLALFCFALARRALPPQYQLYRDLHRACAGFGIHTGVLEL